MTIIETPIVVRFECDYPTEYKSHLIDEKGTGSRAFMGPSIEYCKKQAEIWGWEIHEDFQICPEHRSGRLKR